MIECASVGSGFEGLSEATARSNRAHGYARNAIFPLGVLVHEAVIVDAGAFYWISDGIVYSHLDRVSPVGLNWWLETLWLAESPVMDSFRIRTLGY